MKRRQLSLRMLLVLTFSGVALALVALLSLVVGQISVRQLETDARRSLGIMADEMAGRLEHELTVRYDEIVLEILGTRFKEQWAQELKDVLLAPIASRNNVEIFLLDRTGQVFLTPPNWHGADLNLTEFNFDESNRTVVATWPDGKRYVTGYGATAIHDALPGKQWLVLVRQPLDVAYAPALRIQRQIFAIGTFFAALFALVTWWLAGRLTHQLVSLTQAAEQIRKGKGGTIPILAGTVEVATLSTSLNQLISDLTTATVAERNRIARELHDSVTQTLFSTSMLADVLPQVWNADPAQGRAKLEELRLAVRGALAEMRTLLLELRPTAIADADMQQLMRQLADSTMGRTGINVSWRIEGDCTMGPDRKVVLYRTMQEALNNVIKHAAAENARLVLRETERAVELVITDDGEGFDPTQVTSDHLGLNMMRERIEGNGGSLHIESHPHEGTEIHAVWGRGK